MTSDGMTGESDMGRMTWPLGLTLFDDGPVGVVVVNYNTRDLTAQLIYSLYRRVQRPRFHLVIVDNGSADGSPALLQELASDGMCDALLNREQRYHGPGLNQGIDYLAQRQRTVAEQERLRAVWVLDSDCIIMRDDVLSSAMEVLRQTQAGLVGQWYYDAWRHRDLLALHSLLLDPSLVWQEGITPFQEDGNPSEALQRSAARAGVVAAEFPFTRNGAIIHPGRGTLRALVHREDRSNRYFPWATDHNNPHFTGEAAARLHYRRFLDEFRSNVGDVTAASLIRACGKRR